MRRRIVALGACPHVWLCLLLLWIALSAVRSWETPWREAALTESLRWIMGLGLALALSRWLQHTRQLACALTVLLTGIALCGVLDGFSPTLSGVTGPFHDHQLCGSALLALLPFATAVALTARDARWRWGGQAAAVAGLVCLLLTETRSAWAGLLVSALVFGLLWLSRAAPGRQRLRQGLLCGLAALGLALAFLTLLATTQIQNPFTKRAATLQVLGRDYSWQERLQTWRGAGHLIAERPLLGWGVGRYPGLQWHYTHVGRPLHPQQRPSLSEQAHDFSLQTTAEMGLVGLGLYGAALWAFLIQGLRFLRGRSHRPPGSRDASVIAALTLVAGQSVDALASPSWQFAEVSLLFWAGLGLGLAALQRSSREPRVFSPRPWPRFARMAAAGIAAVIFVAQLFSVGLLTPVEAYSSPAGWTYVTCAISGSAATAHPGDLITYTVLAHYRDAAGTDQSVDISQDSTTHYSPNASNGRDYTAYFGRNGMPKNVFTAPPVTNFTTIQITAYFIDTRLNPVLKNNTPQFMKLTVQP